jgi:hypothetical protein
VIAVVVIVAATFSTGIDSKCLQVRVCCCLGSLAVQAGGGGVGGGRHPLRPGLLPPGVRHGRHVLRHDLRRLEREPHHGEASELDHKTGMIWWSEYEYGLMP